MTLGSTAAHGAMIGAGAKVDKRVGGAHRGWRNFYFAPMKAYFARQQSQGRSAEKPAKKL
jgi:hypothetical protein